MITKLKDINNKLIETYQNDVVNLKKQILIKKILQEDKCFFKIKIETAFSILKDLQIPDHEIKSIYLDLIDIKNYDN